MTTESVESAPPRTNTLAIVSLVSGIIGLTCAMPIAAPLVAVILGHASRKAIRESAGTETGDGMALSGLICGYTGLVINLALVGVFCLSFFAGLFLPVLSNSREKARRINDAGNLKQLSLAMLMYSGDNDGAFPTTPGMLVDQHYMQVGKVWICPNTNTPPPTSSAQIDNGTNFDYVYVAGNLRDDDKQATQVITMYTKPGSFPRWINLAFVDGHVEGVSAASIEEALATHPNFILRQPEDE